MRCGFLLLGSLAVVVPLSAQPRALTAADYAHAEQFMSYNVNALVLHGAARPNWLPDGRFWYRVQTETGPAFVLVNPQAGTRVPCDLPACKERASDEDQQGAPPARPGGDTVLSPDRSRAAFIREWNLWVREIGSGRETQLTFDGVKDFGYATDNAGWSRSNRPVVLWSADSKKIATIQQDQRDVGEMYLVDTRVGHPKLESWKYPLPGDETVTTVQRVIIDIPSVKVVRLRMPPDQHRSSLCDDIACRGEWGDVQWSPDGKQLAFVSTSRDHKDEQLRIADSSTGEVRTVLTERVPTFFESGNGRVSWRFLPSSNEAIWFSERDGWGQLYLYDLRTGTLKHPLTSGEGNVTQLLRVDEAKRVAYFLGVGREKGRDPYFVHLYRTGLDGSTPQLLTPEDAQHDVSFSPSGEFFVDSYSKPDVAPVTLLRRADGSVAMELERADISKLVANGWKPPIPFTVKARDSATDLYGLMYRPTQFDESRKYPLINHIYPGPQTGSIRSRAFAAARGDAQALAELGFIVIELDGMGTPWRSKKFHEAYFGNLADNTLPDQVSAMKQLAARYPWIDLDRAGIYGHSGGGFAAAAAMFDYPDFFKVGISEAGNHDNRSYEDDWAEKWMGLLDAKDPASAKAYEAQANQGRAKNLKGRLLLAHGTMDNNVPPYNTLLVVDALIKANKDFDLLMLPNRTHGFGNEPYMVRRRWDYFVRYLLGAEPPKEYQMHGAGERSATMP